MRYPQRGTTKGYPPNGGTPKWGTPQRGGGYPKNDEKVEGLRVGFAVVVAAVVVEPRRFSRGNWCLQFPKALVRNESRRTASTQKELGWERGSKSSRKIVEKKSSQNGILYSGKA